MTLDNRNDPNATPDIWLWSLVREGDTQAFVTIYNKYWEKAYTQAYWVVYDREVAKDLVQDLFVHLWDKRAQINIEETIGGYLKKAVRNRALNYIKKNEVSRTHNKKISRQAVVQSTSAEDFTHVKELKELYAGEIERLPEKMKEIYLLSREKELSVLEIATALSISEQTVKNQITTALKKIRKALELHYSLFYLFLLYLNICRY
ncbi:RNA polymerase sigma-70 factor [Taibaiella chishuiensis]|uniref:RNA polymerase sigma-70 factor (ECF subfamily) n=1 Tax=Taibaiella chishuiensis TaxID=1434707 RepID=A0A2P8CT36_9BACT|nr:RNA polymerase sigma-70 factor [Taibaiella chishuiensis]PSK88128.1 RNA polymerase sigma-70 factor (ECF subfamily) [Taibaiella chishuiensis]